MNFLDDDILLFVSTIKYCSIYSKVKRNKEKKK